MAAALLARPHGDRKSESLGITQSANDLSHPAFHWHDGFYSLPLGLRPRATQVLARTRGARMEEDSRQEQNDVSYFELDGFRYYPDTFYLNELGGAEGPNPNRHGDQVQLFSCIRLANSLADQLLACIFSTYVVNVPSFSKFYAPVVQRGTPILILHGEAIIHREYNVRTDGEQVEFDNYDVYQKPPVQKADPQATPPRNGRSKATHWRVHQPGNVQIQQCMPRQPDTTDGTAVRGLGTHHGKYCLLFTRDSLYVVIQTMNMRDSHTVEGSWVQRFPARKEMVRKGGLLRHSTGAASEGDEPLSLPPLNTSTTSSPSSSPSSCSSSSSSSTASCTQPPQLSISPTSSPPPASTIHTRSRPPPNSRGDFGVVLTDYLRHETLSVLHKASKDPNGAYMELNTPTAFLQRHFGTDDLDTLFDFSSAAVDLVTTVPCLYRYSEPTPLRYGLERIRELLLERKGDLPQTDRDGTPLEQGKLRLQQTSIMNYDNWATQLAYMQRCMFAKDPFPKGKTEIIWPSWQYFKTCIIAPHRIDIVGADEINWDSKRDTGGLWFLDPEALERLVREVEDPKFPDHWRTFGLHPHCCPTRITNFRECYEKTSPSHWTNVQPHIKTYARGLTAKSDCAGIERGLSWLLLTSACVSKGAQGGYEEFEQGPSNSEQSKRAAAASAKAQQKRRQVVIRYRNFEMGVLFHSSKSRGVLYSHWDTHRPGSPPPNMRVITLPVPYSINAPTYAQRTKHGHPRSPYTNNLCQLKTQLLTREFVRDIEHVFETHKRELKAHRAKQRARAERDGNATGDDDSDDEEEKYGAFTALVVGHHPTARMASRPLPSQAVPHATHRQSPRNAVQIVRHAAKKTKTQESSIVVDLTSTSTSMLVDLTDEEEAVNMCVTVAEKGSAAAAASRVTSGAGKGEAEVVWIE